MRHKKLLFCAVLLLSIGITGLQAQKMYVKDKAGAMAMYSVSDIAKLEFSSLNMIVTKSDGSSEQFLLNNLGYVSFKAPVGIEPRMIKGAAVQIYPNPVADVLYVKVTLETIQSGKIEILSIAGQVVYSQEINNNTNVYQINANFLPNGLYLCRVNNGKLVETVKFLKQ